ncbi:uncharacterized protein EDB91DRAFT_1087987, partial [Suillus paluster]|uniref:uncharacterized protein n=1 Tax=Suillus paluster TaxID=48578 RepID=UPI001B869B20
KILARKLKAALLEVLKRSQLACWKEDIVLGTDHSKPNPFELKVTGDVLRLRPGRSDNIPPMLNKRFTKSFYSSHLRYPNLPCEERLLNHEWDLHEAQANNALNNICCVLNMKYHLYKYKDTFIRGQRANTRTTGVINNADNLIDALAAKYNAVHNALVKLAPRLHKDDNWLLTFKPLNCAKDAVLLRQDNGATVSQQTVSWIWKTHGVSDNTEYGLQDWPELEHIDGKKRCSQCVKK